MMHRILVSLLPLLVAAPLMAQTMVGVRAGLSRSTFSTFSALVDEELSELEALGGTVSEDHRMGVAAGIDVALPLASAIELRVGGAYVQKGYSLDVSGAGGRASSRLEIDYLQFSALGRLGSSRDGPLSVGVLLGPWVGARLSCQGIFDIDLPEIGSISESESCGGDGGKLDFGVAVGGGVELAISQSLSLGLDLVYSIGLSRIDSDPDAPKNRSLALQAGVVVPLGG